MEKSFDGLKVFSATKAKERDVLGETITEWLAKNPGISVVDKIVTQSSDNEFHCLTITFFYKGKVEWNPPAFARETGGSQQRQQRW